MSNSGLYAATEILKVIYEAISNFLLENHIISFAIIVGLLLLIIYSIRVKLKSLIKKALRYNLYKK